MLTLEKVTFEEKVRSMSARQIIELMIDAVKNPVVKLNFRTYGEAIDGVCYGCAATNLVCKVAGVKFTVENIGAVEERAQAVGATDDFLDDFERAIDYLRRGWIGDYNRKAIRLEIAEVEMPDWWDSDDMRLDNDTYQSNLKYFEALAAYQEDPTTPKP